MAKKFYNCKRDSNRNEINPMKCNRYWFYTQTNTYRHTLTHTIINWVNWEIFSIAAEEVQQFRPLTTRSTSVLLVEMSVWEIFIENSIQKNHWFSWKIPISGMTLSFSAILLFFFPFYSDWMLFLWSNIFL